MTTSSRTKFAFWGAMLVLASLAPLKARSDSTDTSTVTQANPFTNSLGMKFVPVPGTKVLFCIWKTRLRDFELFVRETGYDATEGVTSLRSDGWKQRGENWRSPGFEQTPEHPVCGVSWNDAQAFCRWLTRKEGRAYQLPTDAEWSQAVGSAKYPWGDDFPPPPGAGNYAGEEARDGNLPASFHSIAGYRDGSPRTSPVDRFKPNRFGLYDLGGNLCEWCEDFYPGSKTARELRGGSWVNAGPDNLESAIRFGTTSEARVVRYGFRIVLVVSSHP